MKSFDRRCLLSIVLLAATASAAAAQDQVAPETVKKIEAALPDTLPAEPEENRKILIFTKTNGFRHGSIPVGVKAITLLGERTGAFEAVHSEDESVFAPDQLQQFDAVLMLNTTGEVFRPVQMPEDAEQRKQVLEREEQLKQSFLEFVKSGKGVAGIHSATDTYKNWKSYNDMMGGAFVSHPWHTEVPIRLLDPDHPLLKVFSGKGFTVVDEIYQFRNDTAQPSERRMLMSLAPNWEGLSKGDREDDFYPISWIDRYGDGRVFYCSLGHRDEIFYNPDIMRHYLAGLQYVLGDLEADAEPIEIK